MKNQESIRKERNRNRFWVNLFFCLVFALSAVTLLFMTRELILPIILGVFFGYLLRPVFHFQGSTLAIKLMKTLALFSAVFVVGYFAVNFVKQSLPGEKEKLELAVRLQYRLNERYRDLMGVNPKTGTGNFVYNLIGKDLDPVIAKLNSYLSLSPDQRKLFLQYYKGYRGERPIREKYYKYFISNLRIIKAAEAEQEALATTDVTTDVSAASTQSPEGIQLLLHLASIWLIFPLTMIFIILDRGQIRQGFMALIPNRYFELARNVLDHVDQALGSYIRGTLLECALVGLTISTGLWLLGFKANIVVLVGLIGGVTNAIPFLGPALAFAAGAGFALIAEEINPILPFINLNNVLIGMICVMAVAQLLDNAVFQPLVVGGAVNLHPLAVVLGAFVGSMAFGFAGLVLAIPTIVIIKVVTQTLYSGLKDYRII